MGYGRCLLDSYTMIVVTKQISMVCYRRNAFTHAPPPPKPGSVNKFVNKKWVTVEETNLGRQVLATKTVTK